MRARYLTYVKRSHAYTFAAIQALDSNTVGAIRNLMCRISETHDGKDCLLGSIELVVSRNGRPDVDWKKSISGGSNFHTSQITFAIIPVGVLTVIINVATTIYVLHFAVSVVWAPRAVSVTPVVVALATIVFARRVVASATTRWRC